MCETLAIPSTWWVVVGMLYRSSWSWWHRPVIPATRDAKAEGLLVQGLHGLLDELQANLGSLVKSCLKINSGLEIQSSRRVLLYLSCTETWVQSSVLWKKEKKVKMKKIPGKLRFKDNLGYIDILSLSSLPCSTPIAF